MTEIDELQELIIKFRDERDWQQFHNPKDSAISLVLEATELLEHFQWKNEKEMQEHIKTHRQDISDELADVFYVLLLIAYDNKIDLVKAMNSKMAKNQKKYPVNKSKGKNLKYTEL